MAEFSQEEQLNELGRIFRGQVIPEKTGGVVDPDAVHAQIIEIAKTVFLLNPGAIFYLASLVRNSLLVTTRQEIAVVEDMMVALESLVEGPKQDGSIIGRVGPTELANARTALLALEFANSVQNRPELTRFLKIMDRFTGLFRSNVLSTAGTLILPRGEARDNLRTNMANLTGLHSSMLGLLDGLINLVDEYNELDVPSQVSQTALINVRTSLLDLQDSIEASESEDLIRDSRLIVLRSLASKVAVNLLQQFNNINLGVPVLTSDNTGAARDPDAGDGPFLARSTGEGTPAAIITSPGPWVLDDFDGGLLELQIDGGATQSFDLSVVQGPGLHGRNAAPFADDQLYPTWPGDPPYIAPYLGGPTDPPPPPREDYLPKSDLHLIVDKNAYEFQATEFGYVDNDWTYYGPVGPDKEPPLPDNNTPPANLPDAALTADSPRVYPPERTIANMYGEEGELLSDYYNTVRMSPSRKLGFKHLGTPIFFALGTVPAGTPAPAQTGAGLGGWNVDGQDTLEDAGELENLEDRRWDYIFRPRSIFDLDKLTSVTITHVADNTFSAAPGTFDPSWVGFYIRIGGSIANSWERYEIISVKSTGDEAEIDIRGDDPATVEGSVDVFGTRGDYTQITFFPDLLADTDNVADKTGSPHRTPASIPSTCTVKVSPAIKTASIPLGEGGTIGDVITALSNPNNGDIDYPDNRYQHASYHCIFKEQSGFNSRLTVQSRTRFLQDDGHLLQVAGEFFRTDMFLPPQGLGLGGATGQTGTGGTVVASSTPLITMILDLPAGSFDIENVGNYIRVTDAGDAANEGYFYIIAAGTVFGLDPDQVEVINYNNNPSDPNNGSIEWEEYEKGEGHRSTLPGPNPQVTVENSAHEVLGFDIGQQVDATLDPYLSPDELLAILNDGLTGASAEIVETDIFVGECFTYANSFTIQDITTNFETLGIGLGYLVELQEGDNTGVYFVESVSTNIATLSRPPGKASTGFVSSENGIRYRIFVQQVQITSDNTEAGSKIAVVTQPARVSDPATDVFAFPDLAEGVQPAIEAVNEDGELLCLDRLSPGDNDGALVVESVADDGCSANIVGGVSSSLVGLRFAFDSATEASLAQMLTSLQTVRDSRNLLGANNFNENLDRLDAAISSVVTPGQALQANLNRVRALLGDLLRSLTRDFRRVSEFPSINLNESAFNVESAVSSYTAPRVQPLDTLLTALVEYGFDRAVALLLSGSLQEFFDTTASTATFAGNFLDATRTVAADIPDAGVLSVSVEDRMSSATSVDPDVDAEEDFSDADETGQDFLL